MAFQLKKPSVLPGFGLTMGFTLFYLSLLVLIPLAGLVLQTTTMGWSRFVDTVTQPQILASYRLSVGASLAGALVNAVFGFLVAWVLVRYTFPGKKLIDAIVDLPFALPTAVSGIALERALRPRRLDRPPASPRRGDFLLVLGRGDRADLHRSALRGADLAAGAGGPRSPDRRSGRQPGAGRLQTFFRVILPSVLPALLTGFSLAFARALGEYGSVVFIASTSAGDAQIVPMHIISKLEQFDYAGATALGAMMLLASFVLLLTVNVLQWWSRRYAT